jgi:hypothetical protein
MASRTEGLTRHDLEAKIVKHCWQDEGFQKEFTADPGAAFVKYLAVPAASLPRVVVHEETPGSWHIVLPAKPANAGELSEGDLEKVAGGISPTYLVTAAIGSGVAASIATSAAATVQKGW